MSHHPDRASQSSRASRASRPRQRPRREGAPARAAPLALPLARCVRGSSDLTVAPLLTAAGAAMVGMTVPTLFESSDTAARTFDRQVQILERGAGGGSRGGAQGVAAGAAPAFEVG